MFARLASHGPVGNLVNDRTWIIRIAKHVEDCSIAATSVMHWGRLLFDLFAACDRTCNCPHNSPTDDALHTGFALATRRQRPNRRESTLPSRPIADLGRRQPDKGLSSATTRPPNQERASISNDRRQAAFLADGH